MAIVQTAVVNNPTYKSWTITALDADTTLAFAHGFGTTPDYCVVQSVIAASATAGLNVLTVAAGATNITITKTTATASGGTTPGTTVIGKIYAMLPNSAMQG